MFHFHSYGHISVCAIVPSLPQFNASLTWQAVRSNEFDKAPILSACGISIGMELTKVNGRVLETPRVCIIAIFMSWGKKRYTDPAPL